MPKPKTKDWKEYQEKAASFFRSLGLQADTDITIKGVRTKHDIDVLVKSQHAGFQITWLVECKLWRTKVSKVHVLALREIVADTGSDRGIILAENGFQSGAVEAAALTNVHVSTLEELTYRASNEILSMRLRELFDRLIKAKKEYWDIPKRERIEHGLRQDVTNIGYSGDWAIKIVEDLITKGLRGVYPVFPEEIHVMIPKDLVEHEIPKKFESLKELLATAESIVKDLEKRLKTYKNHEKGLK